MKFMQWLKKPTITETIRLNRYAGLGIYREWKETEFPKGYYIWIWKQQGWEVDQKIDEVRDDRRLVGGKKGYITERNGKSSCEQQGIVALCTCQRNEWIDEWMNGPN